MPVEVLFNKGDYVVYPSHGIGVIEQIEVQSVVGMELQVMVIFFKDNQMKLRLPTAKIKSVGLRNLTPLPEMRAALQVLSKKTKVKKLMWSKRAQEYEHKINSGNPSLLCEVIRDLHRSSCETSQSFSERQMYESALRRLSCEMAIVSQIDEKAAQDEINILLNAA
jgi:CarD family transcriptional regulator